MEIAVLSLKAAIDKRTNGVSDSDYLSKLKKQIPFATVLAVNAAARRVMAAEIRNFDVALDRPTNYTRGSLRVVNATKKTLAATIETKKPSGKSTNPASFLSPNNDGGARSVKRFEKLLASAGYMPPGWVCIPSNEMKLDAFGGVPRKLYNEIFRSLKARALVGAPRPSKPTKPRRRPLTHAQRITRLVVSSEAAIHAARFFSIPEKDGPLAPGLYERVRRQEAGARGARIWRSTVKPVLLYVRSARYSKVLNFETVGRVATDQVLEKEFDDALDRAMATAS